MEVIFFTNAFFFKRTQQLGSHFLAVLYLLHLLHILPLREKEKMATCGLWTWAASRTSCKQKCQLSRLPAGIYDRTWPKSYQHIMVRHTCEVAYSMAEPAEVVKGECRIHLFLSKWRGNAEPRTRLFPRHWISPAWLCSSPRRINQRRKANKRIHSARAQVTEGGKVRSLMCYHSFQNFPP